MTGMHEFRSGVSKENPDTVTRMKATLLEWIATLPKSPDPACMSSRHRPEEPKTAKPDTTKHATPEQRTNAYKRWDRHHDTKFTLDEYKAGQQGQDDLDARYKRFDKNGDGYVTCEEFIGPSNQSPTQDDTNSPP